MTRAHSERQVRQQDDPELFEHLENLMFSGATEIEIEGQNYNVARDEDAQGDETFILTPVG